jgi:CBS domain-containing protein
LLEQNSNTPMYVRDLMSVGVYTCPPEMLLVDLARTFLERDLEAAVVLDENGHGVGVISRDDLVRAYARNDYQQKTAEDIMDPSIPQIPAEIPLTAAAQLMLDRGIRTFYITHHAAGREYPAAVLSYRHFLRHIAMRDPAELSDLGVGADRKPPLDTFLERREEARKRNLSAFDNE